VIIVLGSIDTLGLYHAFNPLRSLPKNASLKIIDSFFLKFCQSFHYLVLLSIYYVVLGISCEGTT